jgi:N-acyl-D-amino-acid deacylase
MKVLPALVGVLVGTALVTPAFADAVPAARVHASATRAIGLLEQSVRVWQQNRSCYSCHHQGLTIPLVAEARLRGVAVDEALARQNISVGLQGLKSLDRAAQSVELIDPAGDTGSELVAAKAAGIPRGIAREVYAEMLAKRQRPDGGWNTLDNRPPQAWSRVTATAVAVEALKAYASAARQPDTAARVARARQWLLAVTPRDTEERVFQILGATQAAADPKDLVPLRSALLAEQRADGGWAQLASRQSDAYATGGALVALFACGVRPGDPAFQRGISYLLDTQSEDGSWHVRTRMHEQQLVSPPHFDTGFPHGADQIISAMGTAWAVRALLRTLPERRSLPEPLVSPADWQVVEEAPWMRAALFGTATEVDRLLAAGLDPNSRTQAGTTMLMMAAGDRDKVDVLIRHGADVNLSAKTGFTPLIVAANDPGGAAAVRLLLERGAQATPANPRPLHDGSPMFFAVFSGNVEAIRLLVQHGADPRVRMRVGGVFTAGALEMAVIQNDPATVEALVRAGVNVDTVNDSGLPAITSAVMANRFEVTKALIALGADVNVVDELSMTPLMHAAMVDYGETGMVQLLLAAGASKAARSKDNYTALDLARQHGHEAIVRLLDSPASGN